MRVKKRKTASKRLLRPSQARSDAVRPFSGLGSGVGHIWELETSLTTPGQVRVLLFLSQKRQTATATSDPRGDPKMMSVHKKTPLMQPTSGTVSYINPTNIGSRKHAVFCHPLSIRPPVAAEGRFKVLLRFMIEIATSRPSVNSWMSLIAHKLAVVRRERFVSVCAMGVSL